MQCFSCFNFKHHQDNEVEESKKNDRNNLSQQENIGKIRGRDVKVKKSEEKISSSSIFKENSSRNHDSSKKSDISNLREILNKQQLLADSFSNWSVADYPEQITSLVQIYDT